MSLGLEAQPGKLFLVEGHALGHALDGVLQAFELKLFEGWAGQGFRFLIPKLHVKAMLIPAAPAMSSDKFCAARGSERA